MQVEVGIFKCRGQGLQFAIQGQDGRAFVHVRAEFAKGGIYGQDALDKNFRLGALLSNSFQDAAVYGSYVFYRASPGQIIDADE